MEVIITAKGDIQQTYISVMVSCPQYFNIPYFKKPLSTKQKQMVLYAVSKDDDDDDDDDEIQNLKYCETAVYCLFVCILPF